MLKEAFDTLGHLREQLRAEAQRAGGPKGDRHPSLSLALLEAAGDLLEMACIELPC